MFSVVDGNLLDAKEDYICHQTNCLSQGGAAGLARVLFERFPWADCYKDRTEASKPGTIDVRSGVLLVGGISYHEINVVNMHGQYMPGGPNYKGDCLATRLKYFRSCLIAMIDALPENASYAFPWLIGCGIAGGDWGDYITVLKGFEEYIAGDVRLYRLRDQ